MDCRKISQRYEQELLSNVIPFWEANCVDDEYGGYITCLDRAGTVYDTTKYLWMQWRIVYMFADLARTRGGNSAWLRIAEHGYEFLTRNGKGRDGNYYFAVSQTGVPAIAPYSIYTEYFAALGCAALYNLTGDGSCKAEALKSAERYVSRIDNPKGQWEKKLSGWPKRRTLGHYMMLLNLWDALETHFGMDDHQQDSVELINEILDTFWNPDLDVMFENVCMDGSFDIDSHEGRHLNPGHALEALWFIMDYGGRHGLDESVQRAASMVAPTLEYSWDEEFGGIRYFMDALGKPKIELEVDMKLWWVHCEASLALLFAISVNRSSVLLDWFGKVDDWTWDRFPDSEFGEWYGYLDRSGEVSNEQKGGKWKTFFHLPRFLEVGSTLLNNQIDE